jgi:phage terminase small subunit
MSEQTPKLSDQQRLFIEHYLSCLNGAEAARRAGYSEVGARQQAHRLLTNADIRAEIDARLAELTMPKAEVLHRLSAMARADIGDFFTPAGRGVRLDLARAKKEGLTALIKKYSKSDNGTVTIELHDQQAALQALGKHYRLFIDRQEVSGPNGAPLVDTEALQRAAEELAAWRQQQTDGLSSGPSAAPIVPTSATNTDN